MTRNLKILGEALKERERCMYLAGLVQGREDAVTGHASRLPDLWHSDTGLLRGYVHGFDGWHTAIRNEAKP